MISLLVPFSRTLLASPTPLDYREMIMPRPPKLGKKNGYWYTRAGSPGGIYFGRIGEVSFAKAREEFAAHLKSLGKARPPAQGGVTVAELVERYLDWVQAKRGDRTYDERRRHLDRFVNFRRG